MDFVFVTGKLGQGKTLAAISKIKERIERGCPVATNCDLFLQHMFHRKTDKPRVMRIPDKPTLFDLEMISRGRHKKVGYDESKNGLLVLDECGDWFNSRNWQDKSRADVNSWFRHARKLGWDVYLIVQDISLIDSQARSALAASIARCKRLDKLSIPFITTFSKLFLGHPIRMGKLHLARVEDADGLLIDRWGYRGSNLYSSYDTEQIFNHHYQHGTYSLLTPWHLYGRYQVEMNWQNIMRITTIYWKKFSRLAVFVFTAFLFSFLSYFVLDSRYSSEIDRLSNINVSLDHDGSVQPESESMSFADRFEGWIYDGSMFINNRRTFFMIDDRGIRVTSDAIQLSGITYRELAHCLIELSKSSESVLLQCRYDEE